jgi:DNA-binding transcriptional regulator YhcF (GntR family)
MVIPFRVSFQPGVALYEQVVYAAKKAVISGQMRPGEPFERGNLLKKELEQLVVEAKKLGLDLDQVTEAVTEHWSRLDGTDKAARRKL